MWADTDTKTDFLNYSEVAELAINVIQNPRMRPVSVGVFGTWGTGKSTLLNLIENGLNPAENEEKEYIIVRFDAWLYQGFDDARAALMEVIASTLIVTAKENEGLVTKAKGLLRRVNTMRALGIIAEGGAMMMGLPTFGLLNKGVQSVGDLIEGEADEEDLEDLKNAGKDLTTRTKGLIDPEKRRTPPREIAAFRKEFGEILEQMGKTLVVFVDNLDRCLPKQTIQTLEALRLFLFMSRTAFVIAADDDMVRHSVAEFFKDPSGRHVIDYLDKLIQVPVRVPQLGVQEVRAYMFLLFASVSNEISESRVEALRGRLETNLRRAWEEEPIGTDEALQLLGEHPPADVIRGFTIADRMAPLLAISSSVQGNPRIVKRMLNVVRMRSRLAELRRMPVTVDEALVAKLALFERCTDATAIKYLYSVISDSAGGKPSVIADLEGAKDDTKKFDERCPEEWSKLHLRFIKDWMSLEPSLTNVDLRPALYLSRETVPLRILGGGLSAAATEGLRVLLRVTNTSSPSGKAALAAVPSTENEALMAGIIDELRKHTEWRSKPAGFDGALMLAAHSPEAGRVLAQFIRTTIAKSPPWLNVLIKDAPWFKAGDR